MQRYREVVEAPHRGLNHVIRRRQVNAFTESRDALTHHCLHGAQRDQRVRLDAESHLCPRHIHRALAPFSHRGVIPVQIGKPRDNRVRAGELVAFPEGL